MQTKLHSSNRRTTRSDYKNHAKMKKQYRRDFRTEIRIEIRNKPRGLHRIENEQLSFVRFDFTNVSSPGTIVPFQGCLKKLRSFRFLPKHNYKNNESTGGFSRMRLSLTAFDKENNVEIIFFLHLSLFSKNVLGT